MERETEIVLTVSSDQIALAIMVVAGIVLGPALIRMGSSLLKGQRPGRRSWSYGRALVWMTLLNTIRGMPPQKVLYEWQFRAYGWYDIVVGALFLLGAPVCLVLLIRSFA